MRAIHFSEPAGIEAQRQANEFCIQKNVAELLQAMHDRGRSLDEIGGGLVKVSNNSLQILQMVGSTPGTLKAIESLLQIGVSTLMLALSKAEAERLPNG